jgi:hypothetical protein
LGKKKSDLECLNFRKKRAKIQGNLFLIFKLFIFNDLREKKTKNFREYANIIKIRELTYF